MKLLIILGSIIAALSRCGVNADNCQGCSVGESPDNGDCYKLSDDNKLYACYGTFSGGMEDESVDQICSNGYRVCNNITDAQEHGLTLDLCQSVGESEIFFLKETGIGSGTCSTLLSGYFNDVFGCSGDTADGTIDTFSSSCLLAQEASNPCGVASIYCGETDWYDSDGNLVITGLTDSSGADKNDFEYQSIGLLDSNYGGVLCCQGPTLAPTEMPTYNPSSMPSSNPSNNPTVEPTNNPTNDPTPEPTSPPSEEPTSDPTDEPTSEPTDNPTEQPTEMPTQGCDGCSDDSIGCYDFEIQNQTVYGCKGSFGGNNNGTNATDDAFSICDDSDDTDNSNNLCADGYHICRSRNDLLLSGFTSEDCDNTPENEIYFVCESGIGGMCHSEIIDTDTCDDDLLYDSTIGNDVWACSGSGVDVDTMSNSVFDGSCYSKEDSRFSECNPLNTFCGDNDIYDNNGDAIVSGFDANPFDEVNNIIFENGNYGGVLCCQDRTPTSAPTAMPSIEPTENTPSPTQPTYAPTECVAEYAGWCYVYGDPRYRTSDNLIYDWDGGAAYDIMTTCKEDDHSKGNLPFTITIENGPHSTGALTSYARTTFVSLYNSTGDLVYIIELYIRGTRFRYPPELDGTSAAVGNRNGGGAVRYFDTTEGWFYRSLAGLNLQAGASRVNINTYLCLNVGYGFCTRMRYTNAYTDHYGSNCLFERSCGLCGIEDSDNDQSNDYNIYDENGDIEYLDIEDDDNIEIFAESWCNQDITDIRRVAVSSRANSAIPTECSTSTTTTTGTTTGTSSRRRILEDDTTYDECVNSGVVMEYCNNVFNGYCSDLCENNMALDSTNELYFDSDAWFEQCIKDVCVLSDNEIGSGDIEYGDAMLNGYFIHPILSCYIGCDDTTLEEFFDLVESNNSLNSSSIFSSAVCSDNDGSVTAFSGLTYDYYGTNSYNYLKGCDNDEFSLPFGVIADRKNNNYDITRVFIYFNDEESQSYIELSDVSIDNAYLWTDIDDLTNNVDSVAIEENVKYWFDNGEMIIQDLSNVDSDGDDLTGTMATILFSLDSDSDGTNEDYTLTVSFSAENGLEIEFSDGSNMDDIFNYICGICSFLSFFDTESGLPIYLQSTLLDSVYLSNDDDCNNNITIITENGEECEFTNATEAVLEAESRTTSEPTYNPTGYPSPNPTPNPTPDPTPSPTPNPTPNPTPSPTPNPTADPTPNPSPQPTPNPTPNPTSEPTNNPTPNPTPQPTNENDNEFLDCPDNMYTRSSYGCYNDDNCKICHTQGCSQCSSGYFKLSWDHYCSKCSDVFVGCRFCQDFNGCGQCDDGYYRLYDENCGLWYCQG